MLKSSTFVFFALAATIASAQTVQVSEQQAYRYGPTQYWHYASNGVNGMMYTGSSNNLYGVTNYMDFPADLPQTGDYDVWVHVPDDFADTTNAPYEVRHAGGNTTIYVNQSLYFNKWIKLGRFSMYRGQAIRIRQTDLTFEGWGVKNVGFDDVRFEYVGGATQSQSVAVTNIQMVNASTMRVNFNATWSAGLNPQYRITYNFPGKTVIQTGTPNNFLNSVDCSLFLKGVPKFDKNVRIPIQVELISSAGTKSDNESMELLLPTILIPGIATWPWGEGDGTFPVLENDLQVRSKPTGSFGPGYQLYGSTYPTLTTLTYNRNVDSFRTGGDKLTSLINDMLSRTWATKVNVIGHSKGGLVARAAAEFNGVSSKMKTMVMANSPHTGSMQSIKYASFPSLRPVYGWYAEVIQGPYTNGGLDNPDLPSLNGAYLPSGPRYVLLYSETEKTLIGAYGMFDLFLGLRVIDGYGDGVVSNFSQKGYFFNMRTRSFSGRISSFLGVNIEEVKLSGVHGGALERPDYRNRIFDLFYSSGF